MRKEQSFDMAGRKLFVALPAYDFKVSLKLAVSLARLAQMLPPHGVDMNIGSICGCSVVSRADPEDVLRLMAWASDPKKGIVGGVPRTRKANKVYIAQLDQDEEGVTMNGMGLVRAKRIATAFMLVRREVFERLVSENPQWNYYDHSSDRNLNAVFDFLVTEEGYMGEDYLFCDRARQIGYEVWIDPTIKLGHMGVQEYEGDFGRDILYPMINPIQGEKVA
jgi:hypothetical protein